MFPAPRQPYRLRLALVGFRLAVFFLSFMVITNAIVAMAFAHIVRTVATQSLIPMLFNSFPLNYLYYTTHMRVSQEKSINLLI